MHLDLNCDLGEGCPFDADLMPLVTSANVACTAHAGDLTTVATALKLARDHGTQVGAHPGFVDREHFGRRDLDVDPDLLAEQVRSQIELLRGLADVAGVSVRYVKPHGALYNLACRRDREAAVLVNVAEAAQLPLMALPGSRIEALAGGRVPFIAEGFADRRYLPKGGLVPRSQPDAFLHTPAEAVEQARQLLERGVQTLCVHGDNPQAVAFVRALRDELARAGVTLRPFAVTWPH